MNRPHRHEGVSITLIVLLALIAGCSPTTATKKFSRAFEGGYDPEAGLRQRGHVVRTGTGRNGVQNAKAGYAWQSWQGVLTAPKESGGCEAAAVIVRDSLNKVLGGSCLDELTQQPGRARGQPLSGLLRYNQDGMHGDVHVWLIPDTSETTISYVIFVREEKMKQ
jgi:hypothetical protein